MGPNFVCVPIDRTALASRQVIATITTKDPIVAQLLELSPFRADSCDLQEISKACKLLDRLYRLAARKIKPPKDLFGR